MTRESAPHIYIPLLQRQLNFSLVFLFDLWLCFFFVFFFSFPCNHTLDITEIYNYLILLFLIWGTTLRIFNKNLIIWCEPVFPIYKRICINCSQLRNISRMIIWELALKSYLTIVIKEALKKKFLLYRLLWICFFLNWPVTTKSTE